MRTPVILAAFIVLGFSLSGCAVYEVGSAVVGAGATVVGTAADVTGDVVGAAADTGSSDNAKKDGKD